MRGKEHLMCVYCGGKNELIQIMNIQILINIEYVNTQVQFIKVLEVIMAQSQVPKYEFLQTVHSKANTNKTSVVTDYELAT